MNQPFASISGSGKRQQSRRLLIAATAASLLLTFLPGAAQITYPIRLFTTLIHEGGHALATLLTGGSVVGIAIDPTASGVTASLGGWPPLIYMAGYLGATLFGAASLHLGRKPGAGRGGLALMAAVVLLVTGLWVHPWNNVFGFIAGLTIAGLLILGARFLPEPAAHFLASFLAVQLSLNALYDVRDLLYMTTQTAAGNDAVFMARAYGLTPWFWAGTWAIVAMMILGVSLKAYWRDGK